MNDTLVLIPAYQPTKNLIELTSSLFASGYRILIVDDGSGEKYSDLFEKLGATSTVIGYDENKGKGYAIKYGLEYISEQMRYLDYLIIADSDGQHCEEAINDISNRLHRDGGLVAASRNNFKDKNRKGIKALNSILRLIYSLGTGIYISDMNTGLRGFEMREINWLMTVDGNSFDYETKVLIEAAKRRIPIQTISIRNCEWIQSEIEDSHFNPIHDGSRQLLILLKSLLPSICAMLINYFLTLIIILIVGKNYAGVAAGVMVGNLFGISSSVFMNNTFGYEENFDGVLSYNRILIGQLRFFAYFAFMELICAMMGLGAFLSLIITIIITAAIELFIIKQGVDRKLRLKVRADNAE